MWQIVLIFTERIDTFQSGGTRTFCHLGCILGLEALGLFVLKNQTRKIDKNDKDFLTISSIHA